MTKDKKDSVIALLEKVFKELGDIDDFYPDDYTMIQDAIARIAIIRENKETRPRKLMVISFIEALAEKAAEDKRLKEKISELLETIGESNKPPGTGAGSQQHQKTSPLERGRQIEIGPFLKKALEESDGGGDR